VNNDNWKFKRIECFIPAEMEFENERIGKIEAHYKALAQRVFRINLPHFISKDHKNKRVTVSFRGQNLREIFDIIKRYNVQIPKTVNQSSNALR